MTEIRKSAAAWLDQAVAKEAAAQTDQDRKMADRYLAMAIKRDGEEHDADPKSASLPRA